MTGSQGKAALLAATLIAAPAGAAAQGWIEPRPGFGAVEKLRTEVVVRVEGRVARIEVQEWFRNDGGGLAEGVYLYPLPGETAFSDFSLWQGEQELRGETMDADRARAIYEEIVRRKRDPALIELVGHGLVRASIFPIAPGETRKIALRYTQLLPRAGDALGFRYAASGAGASRVRGDVAPIDFTMIVEDAGAYGDPFSPTHELSVRRVDERMRVRTEDDPRGDVAIFLPLADDAVGITVAAHRPSGGEDGYFMLTLSPGTVEGPVQPRDVTVVMDVSGSMSGAKIEQAKAALRQILGTLEERDRFRLIAFSNGVSTFAEGWAPATAPPLRDAREWIERLRAEGGTNIDGALDEALRLDSPDGRLPIVIFVTDGQPTVGERDPERIAADAEADRGRARVFAFGVGYDVNTYLLDRLGAAGRGGAQYV
ncbi:MAG: VIT domain-containing protein, partial [Longimicrobiales bacterium]